VRDQALWEEDTILEEPLVPGGHTQFRTVHTPGYEGWTVSRYRQFPGPTPDGLPSSILRDMNRDGVDATMLFPNLAALGPAPPGRRDPDHRCQGRGQGDRAGGPARPDHADPAGDPAAAPVLVPGVRADLGGG